MTPASNPILEFLTINGWRLPSILIYIVGLVFALVTWRRHPRASLQSLIAFVLFLVVALFSGALYWFVFWADSGVDSESRTMWFSLGAGLSVLLNIVGWILLLIALFARRPEESAWLPDAPDRFRHPFAETRDPPARREPPSEEIRQ